MFHKYNAKVNTYKQWWAMLEHLVLGIEHEHWALDHKVKTNKNYLKSKFYSCVIKD
jgi:hypothetical protein